jgi:hypothetical protein
MRINFFFECFSALFEKTEYAVAVILADYPEKAFEKQRVIMHSSWSDFDPGKEPIC